MTRAPGGVDLMTRAPGGVDLMARAPWGGVDLLARAPVGFGVVVEGREGERLVYSL